MLGFYSVIKPSGQNSTKVVSVVKKYTKNKCGHLGTLDPMASGVLPVAVGKATKLFDWFLNKDKQYFAIALFGTLTDTLDSEGEVTLKQSVDIKKTQIEQVLHKFCGKITQIPPKYSSVSINGKRAYDLARKGEAIAQMPSKQVSIYSLSVQEIDKNMFGFNISCSAGTYVRSLMLDIAKSLNTVATTVCIIRLASGGFNLLNSYTPQQITDGKARLIKVDEVVNLPKLSLQASISTKLLNGMTVMYNQLDGEYLCYTGNKIIGIAKVQDKKLKITINLWEETND